ncbi:MAG: FdtA/QdtA family cupin domain-containing protein [Terricaulis sp.]
MSPAEGFSSLKALPGGAHTLELPLETDPRGALIAAEFDALPFSPRRVFVVKDAPLGAVRGGHAHKSNCQALVCLAGVVRVELRHEGRTAFVDLNAAHEALVIPAGVWSSQTYLTDDAMLMVLASEPYDAESFIGDA